MGAGDNEARRRRREAIGSLASSDHYPAQLRELLEALAPHDAGGLRVPDRARRLLHLVTQPPPGVGDRLDVRVHGRLTFLQLLDHHLGPGGPSPAELTASDRLADGPDLSRAEMRQILLDALPRL